MNKRKIITLSLVALALILIVSFFVCLFAVMIPRRQSEREREALVREYYSNKLETYEKENNRYADYEVDVAFIGDSLTDGYDLARYYPQFVTANRGIGGETTFGLEERLGVSVYDLKPKAVVMLIGGNNPDTMFENYEDILIGLKENLPNTKIVLISLTAMGEDWGRKNQLAAYNNVKIKLLSEKYGYYFVDAYSPLFDVETGEVYDGYTTDGAHFTDKGYRVLTDTITPVLEECLGTEK